MCVCVCRVLRVTAGSKIFPNIFVNPFIGCSFPFFILPHRGGELRPASQPSQVLLLRRSPRRGRWCFITLTPYSITFLMWKKVFFYYTLQSHILFHLIKNWCLNIQFLCAVDQAVQRKYPLHSACDFFATRNRKTG